jgi:hypothetical protein
MNQFFQIKKKSGASRSLPPKNFADYLPLMVTSVTAKADRFHFASNDA